MRVTRRRCWPRSPVCEHRGRQLLGHGAHALFPRKRRRRPPGEASPGSSAPARAGRALPWPKETSAAEEPTEAALPVGRKRAAAVRKRASGQAPMASIAQRSRPEPETERAHVAARAKVIDPTSVAPNCGQSRIMRRPTKRPVPRSRPTSRGRSRSEHCCSSSPTAASANRSYLAGVGLWRHLGSKWSAMSRSNPRSAMRSRDHRPGSRAQS